MEIDPGDFTIDMGEVMPCALSGTDCNGDQTFFSASWSSSDGSVMTVDSSGNVTGVAGGTSTITAQMTEPIEVYTGQICAPEPVCPTAEPGPQTSGATQVNVVVSGISSDITPDGSGNRNLYVHNNNPQHTNITVQVFHELIGSVSQKVP
jgi:hypothetical protein